MIKPAGKHWAAALVVTAATLATVAQHEGWIDIARPPIAGDVDTIGLGRTGNDVHAGQKADPIVEITKLADNLENKYAAAIRDCVKVQITQEQFSAFTSLAYNIGTSAFCKSTLVKKLNAGDYSGACEQILVWNKFKGKPLRGLTIRRQQEYKQCLN